MVSPSGTISGTGVLVFIDFEAIGASGTSSTLGFSDILLNDGALPMQTVNGSFTVDPVRHKHPSKANPFQRISSH